MTARASAVFGDQDAHPLERQPRCVTIADRGIARDPPFGAVRDSPSVIANLTQSRAFWV
jgi:hypothetical protein